MKSCGSRARSARMRTLSGAYLARPGQLPRRLWNGPRRSRSGRQVSTETKMERLLAASVGLLVRQEPPAAKAISEQVIALRELGLETAEIASILGKPSNYVAAIRTTSKRARAARGGPKRGKPLRK